jgi:polysaccharide biosynthesis/export protein
MKRLIILIVGLFWGGLLWGLTLFISMGYAQGGQVTPPQKTVQGEVAADSDKYVIGPEDVLYVHVWKEEALTRQVPVRMDGKISLPLIDDIQAAGLTPLQLKETITRKFKQYISNPVVSVVVMEANSFKIYVSGQVKNAGVHRLRGETTILQLIPLVGGFTDGADQKKITVVRREEGKDQRFVINYQKIISGEDLGSNVLLKSGDTVIVPLERPEEAKEAILEKMPRGEVKADSDQYVIGPEDVLYIHVWKEEALTRSIPVRMDGNISLPLVHEVKAAGLTPLQLKEDLTRRLKVYVENPIVSVAVMETNSYRVFVSGEVKTPGVYRIRSETSLLQIIPTAGGFTEWANQKKIVIIRKEGGKEKRITVNYKKIVEGEDTGSNVILKPGDTIIVP